MVHYEEHEDGLHVHISRKTVAALLLTLLTAVFSAIGYPVVSMVTTARHDPFTGSQGIALEERIEKLEAPRLADRVRSLELELDDHTHNSEQWKYRIIAIEERLKNE